MAQVYPAFPLEQFECGLDASLEPLEMKERVDWLAAHLMTLLPKNPAVLFPILTAALAIDEQDSEGLSGFAVWPLGEVVARCGLEHLNESFAVLREITIRFTAEFAIRPFLKQHPERTLAQLHAWCSDPDPRVRRLASEGSRPLLPWGGKLLEFLNCPHFTLPLLELLHADSSDFVRLSVANHLNDFTKCHPEWVIHTLRRWLSASPHDANQRKLARHACRTLIKHGNPAALELFGAHHADTLEIVEFSVDSDTVATGGQIGYQLRIRNQGAEEVYVIVDYAVYYRKANGTLRPKVFKGRTRMLAAGEMWKISGRHSFRPVTTRILYPGLHGIEPRVNGRPGALLNFLLVDHSAC